MKDLIIAFLLAMVCTCIFNQINSAPPPDPEQTSSPNQAMNPSQTSIATGGRSVGESQITDPPALYPPNGADSGQAQAMTGTTDHFAATTSDPFAGTSVGQAPIAGRTVTGENENMPLVDEVGFDRDVIKSASPVLVFFCSNASPPCQDVYSSVQAAAAQLEDSFRVVRVDVQAHPTLAQAYGVSTVPTFMIFRDGRKVTEYTGVMPTQELIALARRSLSAS